MPDLILGRDWLGSVHSGGSSCPGVIYRMHDSGDVVLGLVAVDAVRQQLGDDPLRSLLICVVEIRPGLPVTNCTGGFRSSTAPIISATAIRRGSFPRMKMRRCVSSSRSSNLPSTHHAVKKPLPR